MKQVCFKKEGQIHLADSNQQINFPKMILERKEFPGLCIYLKWMYIIYEEFKRVYPYSEL